jgi:hypothetical protein
VLENQPALLAGEQSHRRPRRPPSLGRAAWIEDLKAPLLLVEGEMAVAEDDGVGSREAAAQACTPALRRSGIVNHTHGFPVEFDFERCRQRASQGWLVDVAMDSVHDRTEGLELFEHRNVEKVTGVDHGVGFADQLAASLGEAARALRHVGIGKEDDQTRAGF